MNFLDQLPTLAIICGALLWTINTIVNPLRDAINDLKTAIEDLKVSMAKHQGDFHRLEVWVQEVDDRSRGNQRRIESLEARHENCKANHPVTK